MNESAHETKPGSTFRNLPLTPEQDSEIRHYIHVRQRAGQAWDTAELRAMLADMLNPPEVGDEDSQSLNDSIAAEHGMARHEQDLDGVGEHSAPAHQGGQRD